ncbi:MAG: glycosyltransferase family 4 protein [Candidatus Omnitrophica bacterium]|nr:glycosyltransferase family 4 protein [Candidatus Omnitrophota bacterium]
MLKVLMVNRTDSLEKKGGDTIQMLKTKQYLEKFGIDVFISFQNPPEKKIEVDIIHIFNLQTAKFTYNWVRYAKENNIFCVISPIYWKSNPFTIKAIFSLFKADRWIWKNFIRSPFEPIENRISEKFKLQKKILKLADIILPNSYLEMEHLENKFKLNIKGKTKIIYNGVDNFLKDINFDRKEKLIIQVGHIGPTKNQLTTIKALLNFKEDLIFIGRIENQKYFIECKKIANKRKGKTFFIGELSQKDLIYYYQKAKVHILPSFRETPGLVNLEASVIGCNIVTTTEGSTKEYFGDYAWYCKPYDIESIRKATIKALNSPFNIKLREKIFSEFTLEKAAKETIQAYKVLLNSGV